MTDHFAEKSRDWDERPVPAQISQAVGQLVDALAAKEDLQGKVECRCQNILESPLGERFDAVVSAMALHHVEDTAAAAARFAEHLRPGGLLALADLDSEDGSFHESGTEGVFHRGFDRTSLQSILERAGFESVQFVTALEVKKEDKGPYAVFFVTARRA
jgi:SAM-dependent methyltransferase